MNRILSCFKTKVKSSLRLFESRSSRSSSSSSSFTPQKYDVFLSFRGRDTRKNFVSFLYKDLVAKEIRTFKDDKELERGRPISPELLHAIKGSRIAVVVVSATYPASFWCLEELVKILKREKKGLLKVLPIFYEIDPSHVGRQIGEVARQFKKHEKRESKERVKSWRDALTYLASLSGECSKNWDDDSKLVDDITEKISKMLFSATHNNENNLIGIDEHMNELYPLLDPNSNQGVRVIGIWGRGSSGRSALARHVYENISHHFEAHCFLEDVRRISLNCRKSHLQEELVSKMQGGGLNAKSSHMCLNAIKARLRNKKVLLVANDVDKIEQLDALGEEFSWFGQGSRIIITTQDRQLLNSSGVKSVYEVELLRCYEVRQLFRSLAFKQREDPVGFELSTYRHMNLPDDSMMVDEITERISMLIDTTTTGNGSDIVGIDAHMKALSRLLDLNSKKSVRVVGIWARGGNGIWALAKFIYQNICQHFESHCFLENVKRISQGRHMSHLREEFLVRVQGECLRPSGLENQKVLLVADDVNKLEQLDALAEDFNCFGPGSIVIITTQDKQLLNSPGIKLVYEVEHLRFKKFQKVRELFRQLAFRKRDVSAAFESVLCRGTNLAMEWVGCLRVTSG